jgi:uncharacterized membrane protein
VPAVGVSTFIEARSITYTGILPPPDLLTLYEDVLPGAAERIFLMAEKQGDHRRAMDRGELTLAFVGVITAFVLALIGIIAGTVLGFNGHEISGSIIGGSGLAILCGSFIYGSRNALPPRPGKSEPSGGAVDAGAKPGQSPR